MYDLWWHCTDDDNILRWCWEWRWMTMKDVWCMYDELYVCKNVSVCNMNELTTAQLKCMYPCIRMYYHMYVLRTNVTMNDLYDEQMYDLWWTNSLMMITYKMMRWRWWIYSYEVIYWNDFTIKYVPDINHICHVKNMMYLLWPIKERAIRAQSFTISKCILNM